MDGTSAFMYHFLQGLWFPMLVDIKYLELKRIHRRLQEARDEAPKACATAKVVEDARATADRVRGTS